MKTTIQVNLSNEFSKKLKKVKRSNGVKQKKKYLKIMKANSVFDRLSRPKVKYFHKRKKRSRGIPDDLIIPDEIAQDCSKEGHTSDFKVTSICNFANPDGASLLVIKPMQSAELIEKQLQSSISTSEMTAREDSYLLKCQSNNNINRGVEITKSKVQNCDSSFLKCPEIRNDEITKTGEFKRSPQHEYPTSSETSDSAPEQSIDSIVSKKIQKNVQNFGQDRDGSAVQNDENVNTLNSDTVPSNCTQKERDSEVSTRTSKSDKLDKSKDICDHCGKEMLKRSLKRHFKRCTIFIQKQSENPKKISTITICNGARHSTSSSTSESSGISYKKNPNPTESSPDHAKKSPGFASPIDEKSFNFSDLNGLQVNSISSTHKSKVPCTHCGKHMLKKNIPRHLKTCLKVSKTASTNSEDNQIVQAPVEPIVFKSCGDESPITDEGSDEGIYDDSASTLQLNHEDNSIQQVAENSSFYGEASSIQSVLETNQSGNLLEPHLGHKSNQEHSEDFPLKRIKVENKSLSDSDSETSQSEGTSKVNFQESKDVEMSEDSGTESKESRKDKIESVQKSSYNLLSDLCLSEDSQISSNTHFQSEQFQSYNNITKEKNSNCQSSSEKLDGRNVSEPQSNVSKSVEKSSGGEAKSAIPPNEDSSISKTIKRKTDEVPKTDQTKKSKSSDVKVICGHCGKEMLKRSLSRHTERCLNRQENSKQSAVQVKDEYVLPADFRAKQVNKSKGTCEKCGKEMLKHSIPRHLKSCKGKQESKALKIVEKVEIVKCDNCGKEMNKCTIYQHVKICGKEEKNCQCPFDECNSKFKSKKELKHHIWKVHRNRVACPYDGCDIYLKPALIPAHIETVHKNCPEKLTCDNCGIQMTEKSCLIEHIKSCLAQGVRKYKCKFEDCSRAFLTAPDRSAHVFRVHKTQVSCVFEDCDVRLRPIRLKHHILIIHNESEAGTCDYCQYTTLKVLLPRHFESCKNRQVKIYEMDGCERPLKYSLEIKNKLCSVPSEPMQCPVEGCKSLVKPAGLSKHMSNAHKGKGQQSEDSNHNQVQKKEKIKKPCEKCGKLFERDYLIKHRQLCSLKEIVKQFQCKYEDCNSSFKTAFERSIHVNKVHKERIQCPRDGCDKFLKPASLKDHIKIVHERVKEKCPKCGMELSRNSLNRHLKSCKGNVKQEAIEN